MKKDPKEQEGSERYEKILSESTNTMKLFDKIERSQRRRRFRAWVRWWWNKLTFRGYKNEMEVRRQEEQQFRREIERKARQIESGKK